MLRPCWKCNKPENPFSSPILDWSCAKMVIWDLMEMHILHICSFLFLMESVLSFGMVEFVRSAARKRLPDCCVKIRTPPPAQPLHSSPIPERTAFIAWSISHWLIECLLNGFFIFNYNPPSLSCGTGPTFILWDNLKPYFRKLCICTTRIYNTTPCYCNNHKTTWIAALNSKCASIKWKKEKELYQLVHICCSLRCLFNNHSQTLIHTDFVIAGYHQ